MTDAELTPSEGAGAGEEPQESPEPTDPSLRDLPDREGDPSRTEPVSREEDGR